MYDDAFLVERKIIAFIKSKYRTIFVWASILPAQLSDNTNSFSHTHVFLHRLVFALHRILRTFKSALYYMICNPFQSFFAYSNIVRLRSLSIDGSSCTICSVSIKQLKAFYAVKGLFPLTSRAELHVRSCRTVPKCIIVPNPPSTLLGSPSSVFVSITAKNFTSFTVKTKCL